MESVTGYHFKKGKKEKTKKQKTKNNRQKGCILNHLHEDVAGLKS